MASELANQIQRHYSLSLEHLFVNGSKVILYLKSFLRKEILFFQIIVNNDGLLVLHYNGQPPKTLNTMSELLNEVDAIVLVK